MDLRYDILELTRFFTELSVIDYYFVGQRSSVVALAAIFNAMDAIPAVSEAAIGDLKRELRRLPILDPSQDNVQECARRLRELYTQGGYERPQTSIDAESRNDSVSPVCVSHGVFQQHNHEQLTTSLENETKNSDMFPLEADMSHTQFSIGD